MKISFALFALCLSIGNLCAQVNPIKMDTVEVVSDFKNLYHYQNYYISAQPTYELLQWLHARGVDIIINLRSEKENTDFSCRRFQ